MSQLALKRILFTEKNYTTCIFINLTVFTDAVPKTFNTLYIYF